MATRAHTVGSNRSRRKLGGKYIARLTDFSAEVSASVTIGQSIRINLDKVELCELLGAVKP